MLFPVPIPHSEQNLRIAGASCELQSHRPFATLLAPSLIEPFAPNMGHTEMVERGYNREIIGSLTALVLKIRAADLQWQ